MPVTHEDIAHIHDLFAQLGAISTRKMFGGLGIYNDGTIFALLMSDGALMLKGAGAMPDRYADAGWSQWTYTRKDGAASSMPYWRAPDTLFEDPDLACDWARQALEQL